MRDHRLAAGAVFHKEALYSDETPLFRIPSEPDAGEVCTVRFRTEADNVDAVYWCSEEKRLPMSPVFSEKGFDFYEISIRVGGEPVYYWFEIVSGEETCFYDRRGLSEEVRDRDASFALLPGFHTPDWAKGAVMYQIFVERFCNGDPSNDVVTGEYNYVKRPVKHQDDWNAMPEAFDVANFYGGDLQGVIDKLDYLQSLGVQVLYLNPIFVSPSNHKYDCQDYDHVDPHFGKLVHDAEGVLPEGCEDNNQSPKYVKRVADLENLDASNRLFAELVEEVHRRGMKIILDGVFNHCGSYNCWMDREQLYTGKPGFVPGAYVSKESPYHDYFKFKGDAWPCNGDYEGWWDFETLPKLNYEDSENLKNEILRIGAKWVSPPYNCDGWRLDVAADLGHSEEYNHQFWSDFRAAVRAANPEALILAEHYGNAAPWLQGDQWDSIMNYDAFMEPVSYFLTGMEKHSDSFREDLLGNSEAFAESMLYHMAAMPGPSQLTAMNELDNHDHSRFLTRTNHKAGRVGELGSDAAAEDLNFAILRSAVVMQMTWPGAPTVYYGDEAGVCGFTDPDNRRTYPWGSEDQRLVEFYREMIHLHRRYALLKDGSVKILSGEPGILSYGRFNRSQQMAVLVSTLSYPAEAEIPIWQLGLNRSIGGQHMNRIFKTDESGYSAQEIVTPIEDGMLRVQLPPYGSMIFFHRDDI